MTKRRESNPGGPGPSAVGAGTDAVTVGLRVGTACAQKPETMLPRWTLRAVAALTCLWVTVLPDVSRAQTTTGPSVTLGQASFRFLRQVRRPDGQLPNWISRRDCLEDDPQFDDDPNFQRATIRMSPNVRGFKTGWSLEVWAGSGVDCTDVNQRQGAVARCWLVGRAANANTAVVTIDIRPRKVAGGRDTMDLADDAVSADVCNQEVQLPITFYLMLIDGGGNIQGTVARWENTSLDLLGPTAPTELRAGIGEEALVAHWTVPVAGDQDDIDGFAVYCDVAGGTPAGMGGGGGLGGNGNDGSGTPGCSSSRLIPGQLPPLDLQCARAGGRGTREARAGGLENGVTYAIAVAGVDRVGNSGRLSPLACGVPQEVTTFYEAYREAGGVGGGGFCAWGPPVPVGNFAAGAVGLALLWLRRRAKRS